MDKDLYKIEGKTILTISPVISRLTDDVIMVQIVFTDGSELRIEHDEFSLDWIIKNLKEDSE